MKIKFWGTRGSIPTPDPDCMRYGGDTSCVEVRLSNGNLIILDAGTGIRRLGLSLLKDQAWTRKAAILLSHAHWDHIQGFPFFVPAFLKENHFEILGQFRIDSRLEDILKGQMEHQYFPVKLDAMAATNRFSEMVEETVTIQGATVTSRHLNHPGGVLGYRIEDRGNILTYATDNEHPPEGINPKVVELALFADVFIYDAQYTPEEYPSKVGWGHSTWKAAIEAARAARAKQLILFHHDPTHDDAFIDRIVENARREFPATLGATRDLTINLEPTRALEGEGKAGTTRTAESPFQVQMSGDVLLVTPPGSPSGFTGAEFKNAVLRELEKHPRRLLIDLAGLREISSLALGTLAVFLDFCRKNGVELCLIHVSRFIREVLHVARFTTVARILENDEA
ncbi:MAG: STAS domain-containing protein [Planctomycetes bacterium]|nr:STAS domain-containing protein [Planctomycetota bacterium]